MMTVPAYDKKLSLSRPSAGRQGSAAGGLRKRCARPTSREDQGVHRFTKILPMLTASIGLSAAMPQTIRAAQAGLLDGPQDTSQMCGNAIQAAEASYTLPPGLLFAIGEVESGRPVGNGTTRRPWPWTVQAGHQSHFFATKTAAIRWVQGAQAAGVASIDIGCMQINLLYHPAAFKTLADAFDPAGNANYAARFLISLHRQTGNWVQATGQYHSQTQALAIPYRRRVEAMLSNPAAQPPSPPTRLRAFQMAWDATTDDNGTPLAAPDVTGHWGRLGVKPTIRAGQYNHQSRPIEISDAH